MYIYNKVTNKQLEFTIRSPIEVHKGDFFCLMYQGRIVELEVQKLSILHKPFCAALEINTELDLDMNDIRFNFDVVE